MVDVPYKQASWRTYFLKALVVDNDAPIKQL